MQRIEEDFGGFFKSDTMLQHVALGFILVPLKPNVLKLIFNVHKTKNRLPCYPPIEWPATIVSASAKQQELRACPKLLLQASRG